KAAAVEGGDAFVRGLHCAPLTGRETFCRGPSFGFLHREVPAAKLRAVELRRVIGHRFVATCAHVREDRGNTVGNFLWHRRLAAEGSQFGLEVLGRKREQAHGKGQTLDALSDTDHGRQTEIRTTVLPTHPRPLRESFRAWASRPSWARQTPRGGADRSLQSNRRSR